MRSLLSTLSALASCLVLAGTLRAADNWPQWRGPNAAGIAAEGDYPVKFSADENVAWNVELPGIGSSSPVVWDDSIFVTCMIDGKDGVCCYGVNGEPRWQKTLGPGRDGRHKNGTGANPSPATDGEHVVVYYKSGRVACLDFAGEKLWEVNLQDKYGKDTLWWDLGTSPIIAGKNAIIAVMHAGQGYLVALDLETGNVAWKKDRTYERPEESDQAYTTPQIAKIDGRDVIVTWGADHLTAHDAATGKPLWESGGFNPQNEGMWRVIASHAMGDGIAVVPFGRGKFLAGIRLGGSGDVTKSNRVWEVQGDVGTDVPAPVVQAGKVYVLSDKGKVTCRELKTGKQFWSDELPRSGAKYYASPVLAGGKLYCTREDGVVFVVDVTDGFKLLTAEGNDMGERIIATPAPLRDGLIIRGEKHLFRIGNGETVAASGG
jgi:outer membrane protein assembly factor BamB